MNGSKHISNCYSALQGLYWMSYGAIYTFAAVFLLDRKFTDSQVGTLIALACVFSAIFQPFAAAAADRGKRFSLRSLMTLICLLTIVPMVLLFFFPQQALSGICYVILMLLHLAFQPLLSALGMQLLNNGYYLNFGAARGIGSMSYAVLAFFLGSLTLIFGLRCLPVIGICFTCLWRYYCRHFRKPNGAVLPLCPLEAPFPYCGKIIGLLSSVWASSSFSFPTVPSTPT